MRRGDVVEGVDFKGETHAALAAELVHQDLRAGIAGDVFEEESGASGAVGSLSEFGGAIGNLCHLEDGRDFGGDAFEFSSFSKSRQPVAQTFICHSVSSSSGTF